MNNELKQIVIKTSGVWPEGAIEVSIKGGLITTIYNNWNPKSTFLNYYTRQQYEQCLRELTGRPPVKKWPEGYEWFFQEYNYSFLSKDKPSHDAGSWYCDHQPLLLDGVYMNSIDSTWLLISRQEAAKRDAIIDGSIEMNFEWNNHPVYQPDKLKICNQSYSELGSGCGCDVVLGGVIHNKDSDCDIQSRVINDLLSNKKSLGEEVYSAIDTEGGWWDMLGDNDKYDWFRNGEAPPVGEKVKMLVSNQCSFEYGKDRHGLTGIVMTNYMSGKVPVTVVEYDGVGYCFSTQLIYPSGYNIDAIYEEAIEINNEMRVKEIMNKYSGLSAPEMLSAMIKDGVL